MRVSVSMKLLWSGIGVVLALMFGVSADPSAAAQTTGLKIVVVEGEDAVNIIQ